MVRVGQLLLIGFGICLHLATALFLHRGSNFWFALGLFLWSISPYVVLLAATLIKQRGLCFLLGAFALLAVDANTFWSVFIQPGNSTAALNLLVAPFFNLVCTVPVTLLIEYVSSRLSKRHE